MDTSKAVVRRAQRDDLEEIVRLLAEDELGMKREEYRIPLPGSYIEAFEAIQNDKNTELLVMELDGKVIGTLQLIYTHHLIYKGGKRALIEAVRIDTPYQSLGLGKKLLEWAIDRAKSMGCYMVQLTTNKSRIRAHQFYKRLGFIASHEGMKLLL